MSTLQIDTHHYADATVAAPRGRIDHQSAAELEAALKPLLAAAVERRGALILDFGSVEYISSVGLRVLMIAARQAQAGQAALRMAELRPVVAEIFAISRFDKIIAVSQTLDDALAQCSEAAQAAYRTGDGQP